MLFLPQSAWAGVTSVEILSPTGDTPVDDTAPLITNWSPPDAEIFNTTYQMFRVEVEDTLSGVDWDSITNASVVVDGGTLHPIFLYKDDGAVGILVKEMYVPGPKSITLQAADNAGNIAVSTHQFTLVDSRPPDMGDCHIDGELIGPDDWIANASPVVAIVVRDELPTLGVDAVVGRIGSAVSVPFVSVGSDTYESSFTNLPDGRHELAISASDCSGNLANVTLNLNIDTTGPLIDEATWSPASGCWFNSSSAAITVIAVDGGSGVNAASAAAWLDRAGPKVATEYAAGKIRVGITGLEEGIYTLAVGISDNVGNWSALADPGLTFGVDMRAPGDPGRPWVVGLSAAGSIASGAPVFAWTHARDAKDGIAHSGVNLYELELRRAEDPAWGELRFLIDIPGEGVDLEGVYQWQLAPLALADGEYQARVRARDAAGNYSGWAESDIFGIDTTPPAAPEMAALPAFTNATQIVFSWSRADDADGYDLRHSIRGDAWTTLEGIAEQSLIVPIDGAIDGTVAVGMARARDAAGNTSEWSGPVETRVDRTGPTVTISSPDEAVMTNLPGFTWAWSGSDAGAGVRGYWVRLNDEAWSWTTRSSFTSSALGRGANVLRVRGVDNIGNEGAEAVAADVTLADVFIYDLMPEPGAHAINEVSTIAFSVVGLRDGEMEVFVGGRPIEPWRIVTVINTPERAKFYILLDASVVRPGPMTVTIRIGDVVRFCDYRVLSERTGFGFGRLRPW